jgi:hypothetical protein
MSVENYRQIMELAVADVKQLEVKGQHYGRSWLKRGGVGAFMMLARKWDRIENDASKRDYDILEALKAAGIEGKDLLDDIGDLRRYLLLVESEYLDRQGQVHSNMVPLAEGRGYVGPNGGATAVGQLQL